MCQLKALAAAAKEHGIQGFETSWWLMVRMFEKKNVIIFIAAMQKQYTKWITTGKNTFTPPRKIKPLCMWTINAWAWILPTSVKTSFNKCGTDDDHHGTGDDYLQDTDLHHVVEW